MDGPPLLLWFDQAFMTDPKIDLDLDLLLS